MNAERVDKIDIYAIIPYSTSMSINDLNQHRGLINGILQLSGSPITVSEVVDSERLPQLVAGQKIGFLTQYRILKFSQEHKYIVPDFSGDDSESSKGIFIRNKQIEAINNVYCFLCNLIMCSNIAMPGVIGVQKCVIYLCDEFYRIIDFYSYSNIIQKFKFYATPKLYNGDVKLNDIYEWFSKIELNNHLSVTRLGRAIGAVNHLVFSDLHESTATMWTLVAIETLYCRERSNKQKQIIEKSKVITDVFDNTNDLKNMYDARSRFFHGEMNFQIYPVIATYYLSKEGLEKQDEVNRHLYTALILLFETLQFMVKHNKHDLKFRLNYTLE